LKNSLTSIPKKFQFYEQVYVGCPLHQVALVRPLSPHPQPQQAGLNSVVMVCSDFLVGEAPLVFSISNPLERTYFAPL
jgi:hypothetical protein